MLETLGLGIYMFHKLHSQIIIISANVNLYKLTFLYFFLYEFSP